MNSKSIHINKKSIIRGKKGLLTVSLAVVTLFSATMLSQKTVDASAVNNVATANSVNSKFVKLYNDVTKNSIHVANRSLQNGSNWKTAKAVKGTDGETYLLVGNNEYVNAKDMDLKDETSSQKLSGVVRVGDMQYAQLYTNPLDGAKLITDRSLSGNSNWQTDIKVIVDGVTYYRVATNEWVKGSKVSLISEKSRSEKTYVKNGPEAENTTETNTNDNNTSNNTSNNNGGSSSNNNNNSSTGTDEDGMVTIRISYIKRSTTTNNSWLLKTETRQVKLNSNLTINAPKFDGYTIVPNEDNRTYPVQFDDEQFYVPYTQDGVVPLPPDTPTSTPDGMVNVIINYYKPGDGDDWELSSKLLKTETRQVKQNSTINVVAPQFDGYTVNPEKANQSITAQYDGQEINVPYTQNDAQATTK